jgi:hypothetical protein
MRLMLRTATNCNVFARGCCGCCGCGGCCTGAGYTQLDNEQVAIEDNEKEGLMSPDRYTRYRLTILHCNAHHLCGRETEPACLPALAVFSEPVTSHS